MRNITTRLSTTRYEKKRNEIERYIILYVQKTISRMEFFNIVCY